MQGKRNTRPWPGIRLVSLLKGAVLAAPLFFSGAASAMVPGQQIPDRFEEVSFSSLPGWQSDDHAAALTGFLRLCRKPEILNQDKMFPPISASDLKDLCRDAEKAAEAGGDAPRTFFESQFTPLRIVQSGFVTGYFEPELAASRVRTDTFRYPLLKKPEGLEAVTPENRPQDWPATLSHGRRVNGRLTEMPDRGAIMDGKLDPENLELVWLADPIDAYFVHVQGSARLRLADGGAMRVGYAGKTGHPYTGIARLLVKRGEGTPEDFTAAGLRAWLEAHPDERDQLFRQNRSFIFFREVDEIGLTDGPVGAAGLPLVAGRSLAVDPHFIPYGTMVFIASTLEDHDSGNTPFRRLMVADDTGSAIKGPARGDIFVGSGQRAGTIAGDIRHKADFTILVPTIRLDPAGVTAD
jgi:membrane-bound lytic murein transglycosylase A